MFMCNSDQRTKVTQQTLTKNKELDDVKAIHSNKSEELKSDSCR